MNIRHFCFNLFQVNTYVVWNEGDECVVIDPGFDDADGREVFFGKLSELGIRPCAVLLTHGHPDHVYGAAELQRTFGIPVYMGAEDRKALEACTAMCGPMGMPDPDPGFLSTDPDDGSVISAAGLDFKVIATPGHSPGSVCYLCEEQQVLFSGDTLFAGTIGRTDFPYGEYDDLIRSIMEKLMLLDGATDILPGHGRRSTIGWERSHNPFLEPFNEPEETFDPDAAPVIIHS